MPSKREQLLEIMEDAAKGETKATLRARIAELEAEVERLTKGAESYRDIATRKSNQVADMIRAEALSRTGAVKVKPLVWEYHPAGLVASAGGVGEAYIIDTRIARRVYFLKGMDHGLAYPSVEAAKTAAQADYERRILSALEPAATEGQQPVAWPYAYEFGRSNGDGTYSVFIERSLPAKPHPDWPVKPLYTRPTERAVTDAMVEAAANSIANIWCTGDLKAIARAALKAAMEAGR